MFNPTDLFSTPFCFCVIFCVNFSFYPRYCIAFSWGSWICKQNINTLMCCVMSVNNLFTKMMWVILTHIFSSSKIAKQTQNKHVFETCKLIWHCFDWVWLHLPRDKNNFSNLFSSVRQQVFWAMLRYQILKTDSQRRLITTFGLY